LTLLGGEVLHPLQDPQLDPIAVSKQDGLGAALLAAARVRVLVALPSDVWQVGGARVGAQDLPVKPRVLQKDLSVSSRVKHRHGHGGQ